eukprot:scaffold15503_cov27-Tisochrysis_lutea.AAC.3
MEIVRALTCLVGAFARCARPEGNIHRSRTSTGCRSSKENIRMSVDKGRSSGGTKAPRNAAIGAIALGRLWWR